ncbi:MAG TPA: o-succinylbenzoate synthase [Victivallales bacterium]|nr:o-succinylbenzoate synthase [Victivallales bacterium]
MILHNFKINKFSLPLIKTLNIKGTLLKERSGIIIELIDNEGYSGRGEISPLPGFSRETLCSAIIQTEKIKEKLLFSSIPVKGEALLDSLYLFTKNFNLFPSVVFGLETAIINLISSKTGQSFHQFLSDSFNNKIYINALIDKLDSSVFSQFSYLYKSGYRTIKIKLGKNDPDVEIRMIKELNKVYRGKVKLRFDANAVWNYSEALYYIKSLKNIESLEYIEEPLKDTSLLMKLVRDTDAPIALDENLQSFYSNYPNYLNIINAFVLKPTILGGIRKTMQLVKLSEKIGAVCVISDTFQSGLGVNTLINISSAIPHSGCTAMGLNTYTWLKNDIQGYKIIIKNGVVEL